MNRVMVPDGGNRTRASSKGKTETTEHTQVQRGRWRQQNMRKFKGEDRDNRTCASSKGTSHVWVLCGGRTSSKGKTETTVSENSEKNLNYTPVPSSSDQSPVGLCAEIANTVEHLDRVIETEETGRLKWMMETSRTGQRMEPQWVKRKWESKTPFFESISKSLLMWWSGSNAFMWGSGLSQTQNRTYGLIPPISRTLDWTIGLV